MPPGRLATLDAIRGAALAGMAVYHVAWDLHALGLSGIDPAASLGWTMLGRLVAGVFLTLSGVGLSLAERRHASRGAAIRRLFRIAAAAALVSVVTTAVAPEAPIWFGILHCIVVCNAIALGLWRLPNLALLAIAVAAWTAPMMFAGFAGPGWAWTGLTAREPDTLDFRPIFPWLAPVLLGVALGRTEVVCGPRFSAAASKAVLPLAWVGRRSLTFYLVHQPVILTVLILASGTIPNRSTAIAGLRRPEEASAFLRQCQAQCRDTGGDPDLCAATCHCVLTDLIARPPERRWFRIGARRNDLETAVVQCRGATPTEGG